MPTKNKVAKKAPLSNIEKHLLTREFNKAIQDHYNLLVDVDVVNQKVNINPETDEILELRKKIADLKVKLYLHNIDTISDLLDMIKNHDDILDTDKKECEKEYKDKIIDDIIKPKGDNSKHYIDLFFNYKLNYELKLSFAEVVYKLIEERRELFDYDLKYKKAVKKMKKKKRIIIDDRAWSELVEETYGKIYAYQQQDGCKWPGEYVEFSVPNSEDVESRMISFKEMACGINGHDTGVKFEDWLTVTDEQIISWSLENGENKFWVNLFRTRNFYPMVETLANDLYSKGLLEKGDYAIIVSNGDN